jgi:choline transport protein
MTYQDEGQQPAVTNAKLHEKSLIEVDKGATGSNGETETYVNASGHVQELNRNFNLLSLAGIGLVVGNVWPAIGGSILVAIFNGGPPGVLYEFIAVAICYWTVAASIAELASAIPSSAGVYHWASVTPGSRWGRPIGFFAGWWNYFAWILGTASMTSILGNTIVQMYAVTHPGFVAEAWHVFVVYIIVTWLACALVCLANGTMPALNKFGLFAILAFFLVTVIVVATMPSLEGHDGHASTSFVWSEWSADIGYPDGFVFVAGMLNGAYSVGAVDAVTHLAEEIPNPEQNVPIAMALQVSIGFVTGLCYLISVLYAISDYDALFESAYPIAEIYRQATGSRAGAAGLLSLIMICIGLNVVLIYITSGRTLWALARDGATPFASKLRLVSKKFEVPVNATVVSAALVTILGAIYVGNTTAFNAFVSSFVLLSTSSYVACILPNLLTGRKNINFGPFRMAGLLGFAVNGAACAYMIVWGVIYCFPASLPTTAASMNYTCLIWGGFTIFMALFWTLKARKGYAGPVTTGREVLSIEGTV